LNSAKDFHCHNIYTLITKMWLESFWDRYIERENTDVMKSLTEKIWSKFHEERRKSMIKSDWTCETRIEGTTDQEWINNHNWETKVDIINTKFEDLPNDRKKENLEAANVVINLVYKKIEDWEEITPEMIEEMSEIVHNERLKRNWISWSFENQRVEYQDLTEGEKSKDRNQIIRAIEIIKNKFN
jgi:hypothetical protein